MLCLGYEWLLTATTHSQPRYVMQLHNVSLVLILAERGKWILLCCYCKNAHFGEIDTPPAKLIIVVLRYCWGWDWRPVLTQKSGRLFETTSQKK